MAKLKFPPYFDPSVWAGKFDVEAESFTVNATSIPVATGNQNRMSVAFQNLGATTLFLMPFRGAVANEGWRMLANAVPLEFVWSDWGSAVGSEWSCISNAPGGVLSVMQLAYRPER